MTEIVLYAPTMAKAGDLVFGWGWRPQDGTFLAGDLPARIVTDMGWGTTQQSIVYVALPVQPWVYDYVTYLVNMKRVREVFFFS